MAAPFLTSRDSPHGSTTTARSGVLTDGSLRWVIREIGSVTHVSLSGELDVAATREADALLRRPLTIHPRLVVLDAAGIDFVDTSGLQLLIRTKRDLDARAGRLVISRPPAAFMRLVQAAGLGAEFESIPQEALGSALCPVCEGSLERDDAVCDSCGSRL